MLNASRGLWLDGRECGGSTAYLDFCSLLISFCDERYTLSDCKWPQKPKTPHRLVSRAATVCPELADWNGTATP